MIIDYFLKNREYSELYYKPIFLNGNWSYINNKKEVIIFNSYKLEDYIYNNILEINNNFTNLDKNINNPEFIDNLEQIMSMNYNLFKNLKNFVLSNQCQFQNLWWNQDNGKNDIFFERIFEFNDSYNQYINTNPKISITTYKNIFWNNSLFGTYPIKPIHYLIYDLINKNNWIAFNKYILLNRTIENNQLYYLSDYNIFIIKSNNNLKTFNAPNISALLHNIYKNQNELNLKIITFLKNNKCYLDTKDKYKLNLKYLEYVKNKLTSYLPVQWGGKDN